ncbi:MAG: hypothetical protein NTU76_03215 [Candidatus Taylorbacteria bacterium]|nr:hypothetical protein [Candidatus Taylorbacteria bacterium]
MNVFSKPGDGAAFEDETCLISYVKVDPRHRRQRRLKFEDAVKYVIKLQRKFGFDPRRPKSRLIKAVFERVKSRLLLADCKKELQFFVGVGTCIDCLGIDCFFRCGKEIVTVDLYSGSRKRKGGRIRADIVISRLDFITNKHYQIGDKIAEMLLCPPTEV